MRAVAASIIVMIIALLLPLGAESSPKRLSLCELAKSGDHMNGQRVRINAVYSSDLLEHSSLNDRRCPKLYLLPDEPDEHVDHSLAEFDRALFSSDGPEMSQFELDVSGTYMWVSGEKPHGALLLEKIWSFRRIHSDLNQ